jgi:hypothetical protein
MLRLEATCVDDLEADLYDDPEDEKETETMEGMDETGDSEDQSHKDEDLFDLNLKKLETISEDASSEFYRYDKSRRRWPNAKIHDDYWEIEYQRLDDLCDMYWGVHLEFDQRMRD